LVIIGEQGTDKNKFFSKLLGCSAISNENNISNIIRRFNSFVENKIVIVCNELQSIDNAKHLNTDHLKSLIAERFYTIESKFANLESLSNLSNLILESNNHLSLEIEDGDRKYLMLKSNNDANGNFRYFENIKNQIDEMIYQQLCNYTV
jgi:hypothetical protein